MGKRKVMPPQEWQVLTQQLRSARQDRAVSQEVVSFKAGYVGNQVHQWENGHAVPSVAGFLMWVAALGLRVVVVDDESGS